MKKLMQLEKLKRLKETRERVSQLRMLLSKADVEKRSEEETIATDNYDAKEKEASNYLQIHFMTRAGSESKSIDFQALAIGNYQKRRDATALQLQANRAINNTNRAKVADKRTTEKYLKDRQEREKFDRFYHTQYLKEADSLETLEEETNLDSFRVKEPYDPD